MISNASEIHEELERILETKWLRESQQLSALLRHIVQETLEGRAEGLKEYSLGLEVFHRSPDYDPRNDAIVRVQASLLRKRLAAYYENEGRRSALRITLPRGGYVPQFEAAAPAAVVDIPEPAPPVAQPPDGRRRWRLYLYGLLSGLAVAAAIGAWFNSRPRVTASECPALWSAFVKPGVSTVVSFGVPLFFSGSGGLFVRDTQVNKVADDSRRIEQIGVLLNRTFRPQEDVYTGVGDAIGTHYVARWLEQRGVQAAVANSNYIGPSDFAGKNLVVVSSARFQTLLQHMGLPDRIPFSAEGFGGGYTLSDAMPGELYEYRPRGTDTGVNLSYAVVTLWPGSSPAHRILYLSGVETWSTQGAAEFAVNPESQRDLQRRLDADPVDGPRGRKSPYFQVLLQVEGKNNRVRSSEYVTHRYLPEGDGNRAGTR